MPCQPARALAPTRTQSGAAPSLATLGAKPSPLGNLPGGLDCDGTRVENGDE